MKFWINHYQKNRQREIMKKTKRIFNIIRLSREAFSGYKYQILGLAGLSLAGGIFEGFGINALVPFFSFITSQNSASPDFITSILKGIFSFIGVDFSLRYLLVFIVLLFILKTAVLIISNYIRARIGANYEFHKKNQLLKSTVNASWPFLLKQKLGYLENIISTDVKQGAVLLQMISDIIIIFSSLVVYIVVALNISFYITLISAGLGALFFLLVRPLFRKTKFLSGQVIETNKETAHFINENVLGIKTIKTMGTAEKLIKIGSVQFNKLRNLRIKLLLIKNITSSSIQPISLIFICFVFALAYKTPNFNFAAWLAVLYLIQRIFYYVEQLQTTWHNVNECVPFLNNVLSYERQTFQNREANGGGKNFKLEKNLEFKNVRFGYGGGGAVLDGLNFEIKKGEMVGLIGPSGVGKTTIVDLILRLFEPKEGQILIDGENISLFNLKNYRENFGYVSQDIFLINGSIEDNIKFYDDSISDREMFEAAKLANIHEFIISAPEKYQTKIGDRGIMLSVGQRQRVVLARILAKKPKFLILDEATSALDNESEVQIQKVLAGLKGKITLLTIAHRLSTVINFDKLLALDNGLILEQGSPQELLEDKESYFYKVYNIRK